MATTASGQERLNFPLPAELREHIYSYLLGIKHDCLHDDWSKAQAREFHTQIFKINRTIREESMVYVYRTLKVVRLDYSLPNFEAMAIACNVPLITAPALLPNFDKHILSFSARVTGTSEIPSNEVEVTISKGTLFLVMQDLPALCEMLRVLALRSRKRFIYIDTDYNIPIHPSYQSRPGYSMELIVHVRDIPVALFAGESQKALLVNLKTIVGDVQLSFRDPTNPTSTEITTRNNFPALVWLRARDWNRLEETMYWKGRLEELIQASRLDQAKRILADQYHTTAVDFQHVRLCEVRPTAANFGLARCRRYANVLGDDLLLSCIQLNALCGLLPLVAMRLSKMNEMPEHSPAHTHMHIMRLRFAITLVFYIQGYLSD